MPWQQQLRTLFIVLSHNSTNYCSLFWLIEFISSLRRGDPYLCHLLHKSLSDIHHAFKAIPGELINGAHNDTNSKQQVLIL